MRREHSGNIISSGFSISLSISANYSFFSTRILFRAGGEPGTNHAFLTISTTRLNTWGNIILRSSKEEHCTLSTNPCDCCGLIYLLMHWFTNKLICLDKYILHVPVAWWLEHCVSSAKGCGFNSQETHTDNKCIA